jgi:xylulokinase
VTEPSYLGIDVGTTAIKALLVDGDFRVVGQAGREYPIHCPHRDWAQQDPEDWWSGLVACVREVTAAAPDHHVAALALSTQGDTLCPADADGRALAPARTWMDARTGEEIEELAGHHDPLWWYRRCGMKPAPFHAVATIPWLRKHNPEAFAKAAWFPLVQDFLMFRLTGERVVDAPNASRTLFYNTVERRWDAEIVELIGLDARRVAEARESGTAVGSLLPAAAQELGLTSDAIVCLGAHDQCAAATGCGALAEGSMMLSCGTAWALVTAARSPVLDDRARLQTYCHAFPNGWTVLGAQPGGAVLRWFRDEMAPDLGQDDAAYERLVEEAKAAPKDTGDVVFLPHVYGALTPAWQPQARAGILGLTLQHDRGSLARGLLEGVALEARWNVEVMEEVVGPIEELRMIGGAAKSRAWAQIVADATGKRVVLPEVSEAAAYGVALLAGQAVGAIRQPAAVTERLPVVAELAPRPAERERLDGLSATYRSLFSALAAIWTKVPSDTTDSR